MDKEFASMTEKSLLISAIFFYNLGLKAKLQLMLAYIKK